MFSNKPNKQSFRYPSTIEERKQPKKYTYWIIGGIITLICIKILLITF